MSGEGATHAKKLSCLMALVGCFVLSNALTARAQLPPAPVASPAPASILPAATEPNGTPTANVGPVLLPPDKSQPIRLVRFEKAPVVDGVLNEEEWSRAVVLKDFYQIRPGDNIKPSQPTEVRLGYDTKFLYIGFRAHTGSDKLRSTIAKRDAVLEDDHVRVYLDTFNDQRRAYVFIFNPLGIQQDGIFTEGGTEDYTVDVVMESKGQIDAEGYTVEVAVPFKSFRYEAGKEKQWGVHALRRIKNANNESTSWMPIARSISGFLSQAGHVVGLEGISAERTLELIPSLTLSETGRRVRTLTRAQLRADPSLREPGRFVNEPVKFDPGLTAKFSVASAVTLDLTINPDFAQVEADQLVVTANQRFPIFFPEKRPFFLEGIDIFRTPLGVVDTRAIADPDVAVKLAGKQGRNTFGLLLASDNAPGNFEEDERTEIRQNLENFVRDPARFAFDSRIRLVEQNSLVGILRLKRDVGKENSLGLIATTYNFVDNHNHLGGFDGRFRLNPQTVFTFQALGTHTRQFFYDFEQDRNVYRTGNAFGYSAVLQRTTRNFTYLLSSIGRTSDYRARVGFTRRVNTNNTEWSVRYESDPNPKRTLTSWGLGAGQRLLYDWQGRSQYASTTGRAFAHLSRQTFFQVGYIGGYERLFEEEFGVKRTATREGEFAGPDPERSAPNHNFFFEVGSTPSEKFSFYTYASYIQGVFDLDFGAGPGFPRVSPLALTDPNARLNPGPGNELIIESNITYQPVKAFRLSVDFIKDRLTRQDTGRVSFDDNILSTRATYQFTRDTFARARVDYTSLSAKIFQQYLVGWTPNPGTSFYVGYSDNMNYNGYSPFTSERERGFNLNRRTFFIKMSYLIRKSF